MGSYNTGNANVGAINTGSYNSGNLNTGWANSGNLNTGAFNVGSYNNGFFHLADNQMGHGGASFTINLPGVPAEFDIQANLSVPISVQAPYASVNQNTCICR